VVVAGQNEQNWQFPSWQAIFERRRRMTKDALETLGFVSLGMWLWYILLLVLTQAVAGFILFQSQF
jgi:hypothetical protein